MGNCPARQTKWNYDPLLSDFASVVHLSRNNPNLTNEFFFASSKNRFCAPGRFNDFGRFPSKKVVPRIGPEVTVGSLGVVSTHHFSIWSLPGPRRTKTAYKLM